MLAQLSKYLELEDCAPPAGSCIVVSDREDLSVPRPQGSFVQQHLLSVCLRRKLPCVVLSLTENLNHYKAVMAKCGFGLQSYLNSGQLTFVEGLKMSRFLSENSPVGSGDYEHQKSLPREIYEELKTAVGKVRQSHPGQFPCLFVEDLAVLLDLGFPVNDVFHLIKNLKCFVKDGILVLYATSGNDDGFDAILRNFLFHYASWFLETSGLPSGLSSTIDGQLSIDIRVPEKPSGHHRKVYHFKTQDRRIQFFAPGTSSGIL